MPSELPDAVVKASDGPRLVLSDGSVVRPRVAFDSWDKMLFLHYDGNAAVYGPEVDDPRVEVSFVEDPDAEEIEAVANVMEVEDAE